MGLLLVSLPVYANAPEAQVQPVELPDALRSVCSCESTGKPDNEPVQFDNAGNPLEGKNYDEEGNHWSSDWGACQINDHTWDTQASLMGLDYKNSKDDNYRMALHILDVQGIGAWRHSGYCHHEVLTQN